MLDILPKSGVGAEIGVHKGDFSDALLKRTKPQKLHLIDPWMLSDSKTHESSHYGTNRSSQSIMDNRYQEVLERFAGQIENGKVCVHRTTSLDAASTFEDEYFDYVYIDGDHSYEAVCADIAAFFPKLKTDGLMVGDDYTLHGWWKDGVVKAFHEMLTEQSAIIELMIGNQIAVRKLG